MLQIQEQPNIVLLVDYSKLRLELAAASRLSISKFQLDFWQGKYLLKIKLLGFD